MQGWDLKTVDINIGENGADNFEAGVDLLNRFEFALMFLIVDLKALWSDDFLHWCTAWGSLPQSQYVLSRPCRVEWLELGRWCGRRCRA